MFLNGPLYQIQRQPRVMEVRAGRNSRIEPKRRRLTTQQAAAGPPAPRFSNPTGSLTGVLGRADMRLLDSRSSNAGDHALHLAGAHLVARSSLCRCRRCRRPHAAPAFRHHLHPCALLRRKEGERLPRRRRDGEPRRERQRHALARHRRADGSRRARPHAELDGALRAGERHLHGGRREAREDARGDRPLPDSILETQPDGREWINLGAGKGRYRSSLFREVRVVPRDGLVVTRIPVFRGQGCRSRTLDRTSIWLHLQRD